MDLIRLRDVTIFPRLGVASIEKEWVQKVTLDIEMRLDLRDPAASDDVARTVDYEKIYRRVRDISHSRKFHLIESLAGAIASAILAEFAQVESVLVRLRKTNLPFDANLNCVEVEMERSRQ